MLFFSFKLLAPDFIRLSVGGNLDATTVRDLEPTLDRLVARQPLQLQLELSQLRMIDTIGLGLLVRFSKRLKVGSCVVNVGGLRDQPLLVFRLLGLDRHLGTEPEDACS